MREYRSQIEEPGSKEYQLGLLRNIEDNMVVRDRKFFPNWIVVQEYILKRTEKRGAPSCREHCRWLGVDPKAYTFY